ncbi:MAG: endolytic transglycosylase MltG [Nitrospinota bacterium]
MKNRRGEIRSQNERYRIEEDKYHYSGTMHHKSSFLKKYLLRLTFNPWFLVIFFFLLLTTLTSFYIYEGIITPASHINNPKIINIPKGSDLKTISLILKREGIINSSFIFNILALYKSAEGNLKAGEYYLSADMSPLKILEIILNGRSYRYPVTIPEGYNIFEIASLLHEKGLADKGRFLSLSLNKEFIKSLGIYADNLEGYIFPDTYYISRGTDERIIIKKMVDTFKKAVLDDIVFKSQKKALTFHQIIILASLIEKETGKESEKPIISAVFHNRYKKGMRLQCDPTVIYALLLKDGGNFNGNIKKEDLQIDSPYNTYRYPGLPHGPIANPGRSSIYAALYPSNLNYLYFVSKQDGWHYFSSTLEEHNRAVKIYQKGVEGLRGSRVKE